MIADVISRNQVQASKLRGLNQIPHLDKYSKTNLYQISHLKHILIFRAL